MEVGKKSQLEQRIVVALAIVFALAGLNALRGFGYFKSASRPTVTLLPQMEQKPATPNVMTEPAAAPPVEPVAKVTYTAENLRDPFHSLFPEPPTVDQRPNGGSDAGSWIAPPVEITPPPLALQGLVWGGPAPKAIIGNEVYGVGDAVQGAMIKAIQREGITIELQGHAFHAAIQSGTVGDSR